MITECYRTLAVLLLLAFALPGCSLSSPAARDHDQVDIAIQALHAFQSEKAVQALRSVDDANVDLVRPFLGQSTTCMLSACQTGQAEAVDLILAKGGQTELEVDGMFPLGTAAAGNHTEVIELLLGHGADINKTNEHGMTALDYAFLNRHPEAQKSLESRGGRSGNNQTKRSP